MKQLNYNDILGILNEKLANGGVFFNVNGENGPNTMTIGWAYMGTSWRKNIFIAMIRPQRYSFELIEKTGEFTVSVPTKNALKKELAFAGTKSGRNFNKFEGHGLTAVPAQEIETSIVGECGLHFECRTMLTQDMTPDRMAEELVNGTYAPGDFHTMFFGEILRCYTTDEE